MDSETSFGIIPVRRHQGLWQVLLVQHRQGHWSFPKGRSEPGETPKQCAERELLEETHLQIVRYISDLPFTEHYHLVRNGRPAEKTVTYFIAEVTGIPVHQPSELLACEWLAMDDVMARLTFPEARTLFASVRNKI